MFGSHLHTRDDVELAWRAWTTTEPPTAAVVLVHGFSATKDHPEVVALAEELVARGYEVVSYDARGHGESEGVCTLGDAERHDVAAAVAAARTRAHDVVLLGASMGAIAVLGHAAADPEVAGVVTVSSPARWQIPRTVRTALAAVITQTPLGRWVAARHLGVRLAPRWTRPEPPVRLVRRIHRPLVVLHGADDKFIPPREARVLFDSAVGPRRHVEVPGMGHAFDEAGRDAICDAVRWVLATSADTAVVTSG